MKAGPQFRWGTFAVIGSFALATCLLTVCWGSETGQTVDERESSTWVSDDLPVTDSGGGHAPLASAEDVARELFQIQRQLGGSIVTVDDSGNRSEPSPTIGTSQPTPWIPPQTSQPQYVPPMPYQGPSGEARLRRSPVSVLRDTACQLDVSAHQLELLDLYAQADALREVAQKLRKDARALKDNTAE